MLKVKAIGNQSAKELLKPLIIDRNKPAPDEVLIEILYCGICHSDIHTARSEWGPAMYPCVPGHEIVGQVVQVGKKVKKYKLGQFVGVGCFIDSCGKCLNCKEHEEQFCSNGATYTYNSLDKKTKTQTFGGYSTHITVNQNYVLKLKNGLQLDRIAPLLCAGITTYSPLKRYGTKKGKKVGVIGLGGLGHMAVKIARAMGAEVTVFSTSKAKEKSSKKLGAKNFIFSKDLNQMSQVISKLDLIIDTVAVQHDFSPYLACLKKAGTMVLVGIAPEPNQVSSFSLIHGRKQLAGSLIGGIKETQEMLDFCARKKVYADIELINADQVNEAYERTIKGDVLYRFVIDMKSLK